MSRRMFKTLLFAVSVCCFSAVSAQDATELYNKAKKFINQGKTDSAGVYLSQALALSPDNPEMLEDLLYVQFLDRDFEKALSLGKNLAARPGATVKTYQLVGMVYKEIADYKEGKKVYDKALLKFPNSGLLYSEYGDMLSQMQKPADAIKQWEKGIEMDPAYSGNYYFASKYYAENRSPLWALLYGETFVNIESLSDRSAEIREMITDLSKKTAMFGYPAAPGNAFASAVAATYAKQPPVPAANLSVQELTIRRMNFINEWNKGNNTKFPFKLFEYHDQLIKEGLFDAYNQWLFSAFNPDAYQAWVEANKEKVAAFRQFAGGRVYKVPAGQYYQSK